MKLCFRGIRYSKNAPGIKYTEGIISGKYRGNPWKSHHYHQNIRHISYKLTYRGVSYISNIGINEEDL